MAVSALDDVFRVIDLTGVFANAALGGVVARRERLDPVGFAVLAILSGLGGGVLRDTLLQHGPPVALTDYAYVLTAVAAATLTFLIRIDGPTWNRVWPIVDAIALGAWAATGALRTLQVGLGWLPAVLLGTITAVGGGVLRDVVLRRVPVVLGGNTLYATCAVVASAVMVVFEYHGLDALGLIAATATGALLCLGARWRGWMLPTGDAWNRLPRVRRPRARRTPPPVDGEAQPDVPA